MMQSEIEPEIATSRFDPKDYTVGLIYSHTETYAAAQTMLDVEHQVPGFSVPLDNNSYTLGKLGKHNVVITHLSTGDAPIPSATAVVTSLRHSFPYVRFGLIGSIGGGVPSERHDIHLGDVVVSTPQSGTSGVI
jgi:hypothetical protein